MTNVFWKKRFVNWNKGVPFYQKPEPLIHGKAFWVASGVVSIFALAYCLFFILYLWARHDAYLTNAEDLGIMDQAIWNLIHTGILHQSICNVLHDTNCYSSAGVDRFAIHFEPILYPISFLYLFWPSPKLLLGVQTVVVALGAYPAFWLARLRLRNEWLALAFPVLYLLYPALYNAEISDFHAVTLTATFLFFVLYYMYTRRFAGIFIFSVLALSCKESMPLVIMIYALWYILLFREWRRGFSLFALSLIFLGLGLFIIRTSSPIGKPLLEARYAYLGNSPIQILEHVFTDPVMLVRDHVLEISHLYYIRGLLAPAVYLPLLAPWIFVLSLPTLALNLLSTDANMYSGSFQYNAEMVPVIVYSAIEATIVLSVLTQKVAFKVKQYIGTGNEDQNDSVQLAWSQWQRVHVVRAGMMLICVTFLLFNVFSEGQSAGEVPFVGTFSWPEKSYHNDIAQRLEALIPPGASVSAQSTLVPHISQRKTIYMFPYGDQSADYIFLDVIGDRYPFYGSTQYDPQVKKILSNGSYGQVAAEDGYLLLKRGVPAPGLFIAHQAENSDQAVFHLPNQFCSFIRPDKQRFQQNLANGAIRPVKVAFQNIKDGETDLTLIGYSVNTPKTVHKPGNRIQISTYWQVNRVSHEPLHLTAFTVDGQKKEYMVSTDFADLTWCPSNGWVAGSIVRVTSREFLLPSGTPNGLAHISIALVSQHTPGSKIMDVHARVPLHMIDKSGPVVPTGGTNGLELTTVEVVP